MTALMQELRRALAHHYSMPVRRPHLERMEGRLRRRLQLLQRLQRHGWRHPPLDLLHRLRPLLSLAPLDQALLTSTRQELAERNAQTLAQLQNALAGGGPTLALVSCQSRLNRGQKALRAFQPWADAGLGQPLLVSGDPRLPDWNFRFCPQQRWLRLPCSDSYDGLPQKLLTLLWVLALLPAIPTVLKMDDDAHPANPQALQALSQHLGNDTAAAAGFPIATATPLCLDRGWHIGKSSRRNNEHPFDSLGTERWLSGGTGYLLNGPAVQLLGDFAMHSWGFVQTMLYEDVCVSMLLQAGHSHFYWLHDPTTLGIFSERQQEIEAGHWQVPSEFIHDKHP